MAKRSPKRRSPKRSHKSRSHKRRSPKRSHKRSHKLSPYQKFVKAHMGTKGMHSLADVARKWKKCH